MSEYTYVMTGSEAFGSHFQTIASIERQDEFVEKDLAFGATEQIPLSHVCKIAEFESFDAFSQYLFVERYGVSPGKAEAFASLVQTVPGIVNGRQEINEAMEAIIAHADLFDEITHPDEQKQRQAKRDIAEDILLLADLDDIVDLTGDPLTVQTQ